MKNIFQIRKSELNAKLNRDLYSVTKNHIIEMKIFDDKRTNADDRKKILKKKIKKI